MALNPELAELLKQPAPHPTVLLRAGKLVSYSIDVEIAPMVERLWQLGFWTQFSCQGNLVPGQKAYVCFSGDESAPTVARLLEMPTTSWEHVTIAGLDGWMPLDEASDHVLHVEVGHFETFRSVLRWDSQYTEEITRRLEEL